MSGEKIQFYSGDKLLSTLDCNGERAELFIVCSRVRGPGKTFYFTKKLLDDFMADKKSKFVLFCRSKLELGGVADGMFKSMMSIHYPEWDMYEKIQMKGVYSNIYISTGKDEDKEVLHVGYVIPLASSDQIKRVSSTFSDSVQGYFDEFQPENKDSYLTNEVARFLSCHTSIARGEGKSRRYYPIYFSSNTISISNPYFIAAGLTRKLTPETKFYRGEGLVFEKADNPGLVKAHAETGMARAFSHEKAIHFGDNSWLNDSYACIEKKPQNWGRPHYICTMISGDIKLAVKYYPQVMLYYIDYGVDKNAGLVFNIKYDDMEPNIPLIRGTLAMIKLRQAMEKGIVRFKDLRCKDTCMELFV